MKKLSVIIPVINEEILIGDLCLFLQGIKKSDDRLHEIIIVDGGSEDDTLKILDTYNFNILHSDIKARSAQMNLGAQRAKGDVLYFVHADVLPPKQFIDNIAEAINKKYDFGCFSYRFDSTTFLLKLNAGFTRRDSVIIGGGDQTLFIKRAVFETLGGFDENHIIMEDYHLYWRAKRQFKHTIIKNDATVSARKYAKNSYLHVQLANFIVFNGYRLGFSQEKLVRWYKKLLKF